MAASRRAFATSVFLVCALLASTALAQSPPRAIKVLEEEINLLKETIETNNNRLRKLKEKLKKAATADKIREKAIDNLRRRMARIDVLKKELQAVEAKMAEALTQEGSDDRARLRMIADVRIRPEFTQNREDVNSDLEDKDAFWGHRARLGADFGFDDWVRARVVVQEARTFGESSNQARGVALHEAWVDLTPPLVPGLRIRVGRTELSYGGERLVGRDDFALDGQAFDGGLLHFDYKDFIDIDAFFTKLRESQGSGDDDRDFFGVYARTAAIPYVNLEVYYFGLLDTQLVNQTVATETVQRKFESAIHTIGARAELLVGGFRLDAEAIFQLGERTDPNDPEKELEHFATAYFADISYQIQVTTYPTFGAFFAWASGDANPNDEKSVDFLPLFPSRHAILGAMDMLSWSNIMDVGGDIEFTFPLGFGFRGAMHYFLLTATAEDGGRGELFGLGGGRTPDENIGRNVGMEVDLVLSWSPNDQLAIEQGFSWFRPSTVPEELGLGTDDAYWTYLQIRAQY